MSENKWYGKASIDSWGGNEGMLQFQFMENLDLLYFISH